MIPLFGGKITPKFFTVYADDITITCTGNNTSEVRNIMQAYMHSFEHWADEWGLKVNPQKSAMQHFTRKSNINCPIIRFKGSVIEYKKETKLLGMILDSPKLNWKPHINSLIIDCKRRINVLQGLSSPVWGSTARTLRMLYIAYIRSKID